MPENLNDVRFRAKMLVVADNLARVFDHGGETPKKIVDESSKCFTC